MGGMLAAFDKQDSSDLHFTDTIKGGDSINNQRLVRVLVDNARESAQDLDGYGTNFDKENNHYKLFPYTGSSIPRGVLADEPYHGGYVRGLVNEVEKRGIQVLVHIMIFDLIKEKGKVIGAVGLELDTDTIVFISAKTVVLATGGAGNLYNLTTNPSDLTGDGYAIAYRSGAQLSDMEFVQGRVCMIYPKGMRGTPPPGDGLVTIGGRFYNVLCERYMRKYHPEKLELVTRAQMSICAQKEIQAGRNTPNGGVYGDLSGVARDDLNKFQKFMNVCASENFDPSWQPYEWAPGIHHFMGGVVINEKCETGIEGLYAAGEIVAGVHGANRLAGNALTETLVFGKIAGESAAKQALSSPQVHIGPERINGIKERIEGIIKRDNGVDPLEVKSDLLNMMSLHVGVIRNEAGLRKALQSIEAIRKKKIGKLCLSAKDKSLTSLSILMEVENLAVVGELVTTAALMRTETRGAHNREDYPELIDNWAKHIVFHRENDTMDVTLKPIEKI
jgi:fumarate reductase (CoM/CoB) subunit A